MNAYDGMCVVKSHYVPGTGDLDHLEVVQADEFIQISDEVLATMEPHVRVEGDLVHIAGQVTYRVVGRSLKYPGAVNAEKVA